MDTVKTGSVIVCDCCKAEFRANTIEFKHTNAVIDDKRFDDIVYYTCPACGKAYVVCMLDYWGKKLQEKCVEALNKYRALYNTGKAPQVLLQQKLKKVETLKADALSYQHEVLHKYGDLLPEEIFS